MANFISNLSNEEAKRLSANDMEMLYSLQAKANGEIPSDEKNKTEFQQYIKNRCKELMDDEGYAASLEKTFC